MWSGGAGRSWPLKVPSHQKPGSGFPRLQNTGRIGSVSRGLDTAWGAPEQFGER